MPAGFVYDDGGREAAGFAGHAGDCIARSIAIASKRPYGHVYNGIARIVAKYGYPPTADMEIINKIEKRRRKAGATRKKTGTKGRELSIEIFNHFQMEKVKLGKGVKPTWLEAWQEYGDCVVSTTRHVAAIIDGCQRDTHNEVLYIWRDADGLEEIRERKAASVWISKAKPMFDGIQIRLPPGFKFD